MADHMLTTKDNPYNPNTHFDEWLAFDTRMGYNTLGVLANVTITADTLSDADQDLAIETAIDEIVNEDVLDLYKKVEVSG